MARSYMYFPQRGRRSRHGGEAFTGTTADQAYFCKTTVSQACRDAVLATRDQITAYANAKGDLIANVSFFVDGPRPACLAKKACACDKPRRTYG